MNYYELCKKFIQCPIYKDFDNYANITFKEWCDFYDFMENKYGGNWNKKECQQYINRVHKLILTKIS